VRSLTGEVAGIADTAAADTAMARVPNPGRAVPPNLRRDPAKVPSRARAILRAITVEAADTEAVAGMATTVPRTHLAAANPERDPNRSPESRRPRVPGRPVTHLRPRRPLLLPPPPHRHPPLRADPAAAGTNTAATGEMEGGLEKLSSPMSNVQIYVCPQPIATGYNYAHCAPLESYLFETINGRVSIFGKC